MAIRPLGQNRTRTDNFSLIPNISILCECSIRELVITIYILKLLKGIYSSVFVILVSYY
nr:MAG TPA: hypothetical protein [Caudoviricetes sp.]